MVFAKGFRSKMEKMFSSSDQDREILNDPPPPYSLPPDFIDAGIKEDDLAILRDYDTVIILDDSGSMTPLWAQVEPFSPSWSRRSLTNGVLACRRAGYWGYSQRLLLNTTRTESTSISSTTTKWGNI